MKKQTISANKLQAPALLALLLCFGSFTAKAGLISILRGDGASETGQAAAPQRVAFVGEAVVRSISGDAQILDGIDQWGVLSPGDKLVPGTVLRTGTSGHVVIRMQSGSFVSMTPNTILRLISFEKWMDPAVLSGKEEAKGFTVRSVRGQALVRIGDVEWHSLDVNSILPEGTLLQTSKEGSVDLFERSSGRTLRVEGKTEVTINSAVMAQRLIKSETAPVFAAASR